MFGKYQNIFRSRWNALFWAAGVLTTAYCSIPGDGDDDLATLAALSKLTSHKAAEHPAKNPWAIDKKPQPSGG